MFQNHIIDITRIRQASRADKMRVIETLNQTLDEAGEVRDEDALCCAHFLLSPNGENDIEAWTNRIGPKGRAQAVESIRQIAIDVAFLKTQQHASANDMNHPLSRRESIAPFTFRH